MAHIASNSFSLTEYKLAVKKGVRYLYLIDTVRCLICSGDVDCRMNSDPYSNSQIFAVVTIISETLMKASAFYHANFHLLIIKAQEPVGQLVLLAVFLILR
jgi:hypothetical protein